MRDLLQNLFPLHRRYERFCALAATGQLGGSEMFELNAHVAACHSCREFLESVTQVSVQTLPILAEGRIPATEATPPPGMRARFISRLAAESRVSPFPEPIEELVFQRVDPRSIPPKTKPKDRAHKFSRKNLFLWRVASGVAAGAVLALTGFYVGKQTLPGPKAVASSPALESSTARESSAPSSVLSTPDRVPQLEQEKTALDQRLSSVKEKLSESLEQQESMRQQLDVLNEKLTEAQSSLATAKRIVPDAQQAKFELALMHSEVDRLNKKLKDSEEQVTTQQQITQQIAEKLDITEADLRKERDLKAAKGEMGELVGSRNLHIVDVYDADPSGKQQRAFGRVFYIENKSLVFYAYDLGDARQHKANVVFHVWGGKAGVKEVTHSLGILHKDDAGQDRWAMTFDDSRVLSQINSVFVTAESSSKSDNSPHGRKVLYAYFGGQPNHP